MQSASYDVLKRDDVYLIWVEQARELEEARSRIIQLAAQSHIEHVVFDRSTGKIVARAIPGGSEQLPWNNNCAS